MVSDDTGVFWGLKYYNDVLIQAGETGNVQTEILLNKDMENFSFKNGWGFPRRILFNGDECVMPSPDEYPRLPRSASYSSRDSSFVTSVLCFLLLLV